MVQSPENKAQVWVRDVILILFLLLNTYLILTGHQTLSADVLRDVQAQATQCPKPPASAELPHYIRSEA